MNLKLVNISDVKPDTEYLIVSDINQWTVAEYWPSMDEGRQWYNGDVFCDAKEVYYLPELEE